jgi:hypothetical protein
MNDDRQFWIEVRRGLLLVVRAIESRWNLPRGGDVPLGAAPLNEAPQIRESPPVAPARSSTERVG